MNGNSTAAPLPARRARAFSSRRLAPFRQGIDFAVWMLRQPLVPDARQVADEFDVPVGEARNMLRHWSESAADARFNAPGIEY